MNRPTPPAVLVEKGKRRRLSCTLCYRRCTLDPGEAGPCGHRRNDGGRMALVGHGEITSMQRNMTGINGDPFSTFKPNSPSMFIGGTRCTAACTFCSSGKAVHRPESLPKVEPTSPVAPEHQHLTDAALGDQWYGPRGYLDPELAAMTAVEYGASSVTLGINEPLLTWEWTYAFARAAKDRDLDVCLETNGFATPEAIRRLAPFVDAVDVGIKGSSDPEFYARRMRSPGGDVAALEAIRTWRETGTHVIVGDLLAPPAMQDEERFTENARRLYSAIYDACGPVVDVLTTIILRPMPIGGARPGEPMSPEQDWPEYIDRTKQARQLALDAGLQFVRNYPRSLTCPCGADLLTNIDVCGDKLGEDAPCAISTTFCPFQTTTTSVHPDGRCLSCGTQTPVVPMTPAEHAHARGVITTTWQEAQ